MARIFKKGRSGRVREFIKSPNNQFLELGRGGHISRGHARWYDEKILKAVEDITDEVGRDGAAMMAAHMRKTTRFEDDTGELRGSIDSYKSRFLNGGYVAGAFDEKAHLIEFGTNERERKTGGRTGLVEARPFVNDAVEAVRRRLFNMYKRAIEP